MDQPSAPAADEQLADVRRLVTGATQRLLGATIAVTDEQWAAPSRLPRWSRAHVATHLARQADGLTRLVEGAAVGEHRTMYSSREARDAEIEAGARRTGLELQSDLDTTAGRLTEAFERLDHVGPSATTGWTASVEMRNLVAPARLLPLARLFEVELHLVDLDVGHEVSDVDAASAEWLLEWFAFRATARDEFPRVELRASSGFTTTVGSVGGPVVVRGSAPALLGWLTGRTDPDAVEGAGGLRMPSL
ncbi:maleylpyruvate isomerase family mycothiol-dependent enzyme [Microlunatus flavus]|uniref:maleylpyruvate isomerase family mycothiol-dependent enzyme n=1 Tax=Microlunatus flavus TaxID=1036181 RepID=UPI00147A53D0|nr:maleylpyruvate isomerase family mycothiol-dependent enzyme [Microlunatus flavus]